MNSFANSLFSLLFGWAKTLIQRVWTAASTGGFSGFFTWLGDNWLWVALLLCLAGTVVDFCVWMVRWRPYLVWQTHLRRLSRRFQGQGRMAQRMEQGYQSAVDLDVPMDEAPPQQDLWDPADWDIPAAPLWEEADGSAAVPAADGGDGGAPYEPAPVQQPAAPVYVDAVSSAAPAPVYAPPPALALSDLQLAAGGADALSASERRRRFVPPAYELPPTNVSTRASSSFGSDLPRRKRRSEKYDRRKPAWHLLGDEEENALLDGLPPAADPSASFHEPVFPQPRPASGGDYAAWQRPAAYPQTNGNQQ